MATNLRLMFWMLQLAAGHMTAAGGGKVIVTSSVSAFKLEPFVSGICVTSKPGVTSLLRQAAFELVAYGINVNALALGTCVTNIGGGR